MNCRRQYLLRPLIEPLGTHNFKLLESDRDIFFVVTLRDGEQFLFRIIGRKPRRPLDFFLFFRFKRERMFFYRPNFLDFLLHTLCLLVYVELPLVEQFFFFNEALFGFFVLVFFLLFKFFEFCADGCGFSFSYIDNFLRFFFRLELHLADTQLHGTLLPQ